MNAKETDRSIKGFAELFGQTFPPEVTLTEDSAWMSMTNTTVQYVSSVMPGKMAPQLVKRVHFVSFAGMLRAVELKRKSIRRKNKKVAAAVYEYSADCDGDWGEISFDFVHGTAEILTLAGGDSSRTNRYARAAIREILSWAGNDLPRNWIVAMEP